MTLPYRSVGKMSFSADSEFREVRRSSSKKTAVVLFSLLSFQATFIQCVWPAHPAKQGTQGEEKTQPAFVNDVYAVKSKEEFEQKVIASEKPSLVEFYSGWCPPCRKMAPIINEFALKHSAQI